MKLPIYLDYSSTTPVDLRVANKMMKYLTFDGIFGNPASRSHRYGWEAEEAVNIARNNIAKLLGSNKREIFFTSGATESNNLAIKGIAQAACKEGRRHIITSVTEHKSVLDSCKELENQGFEITWLVPQKNGLITINQLNSAIRNDTILVSIMHVNNEIGIIQDITSFGNLCNCKNILFHVDATQSIGKLSINLLNLPVDLMSFSSHKLYGPKGIGGLYIRSKPNQIKIKAQIHGGGHERGIRSGTLPVHQIVGMGEAYRIAAENMQTEYIRLNALHYRLWSGLKKIKGITFNGNLEYCLKTILNISISDVDSEMLMIELKDLAVSSGSACLSSNLESSYVLRSLGISNKLAQNSIRFSLGRFTTTKDIDYSIIKIDNAINRLRRIK